MAAAFSLQPVLRIANEGGQGSRQNHARQRVRKIGQDNFLIFCIVKDAEKKMLGTKHSFILVLVSLRAILELTMNMTAIRNKTMTDKPQTDRRCNHCLNLGEWPRHCHKCMKLIPNTDWFLTGDRRKMSKEQHSTDKPAMTIEEIHHLKTLENPEAQVIQALQFCSRLHELACFEAVLKKSRGAYARGRREGLEEVGRIIQAAHNKLDLTISCQDHDPQWNDQAILLEVLLDKIRALIEKEKQDE